MIPATSLKQIYNFKGEFNAATRSILGAAGLQDVLIERSGDTQPLSRFEVSFDMGPPNNETNVHGDDVYDFFEGCMLTIKLCTVRPDDQPSALPGVATLHDEFVATSYSVMEERKSPFEGILQYYQVLKILPRGTKSGLNPQWLEDWTQIEFEIWFGIRPAAFLAADGSALT